MKKKSLNYPSGLRTSPINSGTRKNWKVFIHFPKNQGWILGCNSPRKTWSQSRLVRVSRRYVVDTLLHLIFIRQIFRRHSNSWNCDRTQHQLSVISTWKESIGGSWTRRKASWTWHTDVRSHDTRHWWKVQGIRLPISWTNFLTTFLAFLGDPLWSTRSSSHLLGWSKILEWSFDRWWITQNEI